MRKGIQWWTNSMTSGSRGVTGLIRRASVTAKRHCNFFVALKEAPLNLGQQNRWPKLLSRVRNANCDNGHKHIYGHDWKEETSHVWTFSASDYNQLPDNLSSTLPFSEIGGKKPQRIGI